MVFISNSSPPLTENKAHAAELRKGKSSKKIYQSNKREWVLTLPLKINALPTSLLSNIKDGNHTVHDAMIENSMKCQGTH